MRSVSLYGRGGQGVKTAAHIVGTASFLSGFNVQDQPLYGAERRGAPISAYVRISKDVIMERGEINNPSLIVIGDDSLLDNKNENPLQHASESTAVLVNSSLLKPEIVSKYTINNLLIVSDLTALTTDLTKTSVLGVAVAAATCKLLELNFDVVRQSIIKELNDIQVNSEEISKNLNLAKKVFDSIQHENILNAGTKSVGESNMYEPKYHEPVVSTCTITATGNSLLRERWQWSSYKPIIDYDGCTKCMICYVYCPDSAYTIDKNGYPVIDYGACKGCDICQTECPVKVITLVKREKK